MNTHFQVTATLKNPDFDEAVSILERHGLSTQRDLNTGRIACYKVRADAEHTRELLLSSMPHIPWRIVEVAL
jgi:hypothetical protein